MTSWEDFAAAEPDLAARVKALFTAQKHCVLATLRRDGSPRVSGIEVDFAEDGLHLGSMPRALKALDLRRDPRFALHCPTSDVPEGDASSWEGDAKLAGVAHEVGDPSQPDGGHRFRLDLTEVVLTRVGDPADHLVIESWHPDRGLERHRR